MKRALVFSALGKNTGCALRARYLAKGLEENGWQATLVLPPFESLPLSLEAFLSLPYFLWRALWQRADLAVGIKPYPNCWAALALARLRGARAVVDVDDLDGAYRGGWAGKLVGLAQAPAFLLLDHFSTHHPAIRESRPGLNWIELGQGVDCSVFKPWRQQPDKKTLFYTAHLNVAAQLELLMEWLAPLLKAQPDLSLVVAGGGPLLASYRSRYASSQVRFLGALPPEEIAREMAKASLCLAAYGLGAGNGHRVPMKIGEYLAMAKPVLSNPISGLAAMRPFLILSPANGAAYRRLLLQRLRGPGDGREKRGAAWIRRQRSLKVTAARFLRQLP